MPKPRKSLDAPTCKALLLELSQINERQDALLKALYTSDEATEHAAAALAAEGSRVFWAPRWDTSQRVARIMVAEVSAPLLQPVRLKGSYKAHRDEESGSLESLWTVTATLPSGKTLTFGEALERQAGSLVDHTDPAALIEFGFITGHPKAGDIQDLHVRGLLSREDPSLQALGFEASEWGERCTQMFEYSGIPETLVLQPRAIAPTLAPSGPVFAAP